MQRKFKALGVGLGLLAVLAIMPAKAVTTVVNEDFEGGDPGTVPDGWTAFGGTALFTPGTDDTRANIYGNYAGGYTMALTNPYLEPAGMAGVIFYDGSVDINNNKLLIEFDLLISPGTSPTPADGCCIMVVPSPPTATGAGGGGMGWSGLGGFAVEFDIYDNGGTDPDDLVGQTDWQLGDPVGNVEGNTLNNPAARQVGVDVQRFNVAGDQVNSIITEDDEGNVAVYPNVPDFVAPYDLFSTVITHVWIEYDNGYIKVEMSQRDEFDEYAEFTFERDIVLEGVIGPWIFLNEECPGGPAYIGFAGSTGASNALQEVDNLVIQLDPNIGEPMYNPDIPTSSELPAALKVGEVGEATEQGWNVSTVKLNEESGQFFASVDATAAMLKTHWVLDNTPPTGSETSLLVNYASGENAANANPFAAESGYPGIAFMPLDPPAEEQIDNFAVRATGFIEFPEAGPYQLGASHDDGVTVFIGGEVVFQNLGTGAQQSLFVVTEPGLYPIQVDMFESGYYSYLSVYQFDGCTGISTLINDGSPVKVYTQLDGASIPPTNYGQYNIATADPADKVGEVGEGTNPGFDYIYRNIDTNIFQLNGYIDADIALNAALPANMILNEVTGVVDVANWSGAGEQQGFQPGEMILPDGEADDVTIRVTGFAEFPEPGMYALFVSSDDGFEAGVGSVQTGTAGNKGASDVPAFVTITEAGLYPIQVTWYERGGGNNFEFTQWTETGAALVNGADATVKVYLNAPSEDDAMFLPPAFSVQKAADIGSCMDPGFNVRFVKHPGGVGNLGQCEELLAGQRPIDYEDISVQPLIDFWSTAGEGNFVTGVPYPTLTAGVDDNDFAIEATGFIELQAGWHTFGVNSDDGFGLDIGGWRVCEYYDGRGTADTLGSVLIPEAGIYPIRLAHWEGGGGAAVELFYVNPDSSYVLVNDTANGAPAVCTAVEGGEPEAATITSIMADGSGNVVVTWEGGTAPYQVQMADEVAGPWTNYGDATAEMTATIPADAAAAFIKVVPAN